MKSNRSFRRSANPQCSREFEGFSRRRPDSNWWTVRIVASQVFPANQHVLGLSVLRCLGRTPVSCLLSAGATVTEQMFSTRLPHFCPGAHCEKRCGPSDCTCRPSGPDCEFCRERRATAKPHVRFEIAPNFEHRQLRLLNDFTSNQRSSK